MNGPANAARPPRPGPARPGPARAGLHRLARCAWQPSVECYPRPVALTRLNQLDVYYLGSRNSPVPFISERQPPAVGHVVIECRRRRELEKLDLQRLPICAAAPRAL